MESDPKKNLSLGGVLYSGAKETGFIPCLIPYSPHASAFPSLNAEGFSRRDQVVIQGGQVSPTQLILRPPCVK